MCHRHCVSWPLVDCGPQFALIVEELVVPTPIQALVLTRTFYFFLPTYSLDFSIRFYSLLDASIPLPTITKDTYSRVYKLSVHKHSYN